MIRGRCSDSRMAVGRREVVGWEVKCRKRVSSMG